MTAIATKIARASRTHFYGDGRSSTIATNGMVATSHPAASLTAIDVLRAGGNAADAAIAASAVLAVVEPHMTGIGGDCFAIVAPPDGGLYGLNGSGAAPAALTADLVRATGAMTIVETSPHAVTVPGALRTWDKLLSEYGTKTFDELFRPAIQYAEEGFAIAPRVGRDWGKAEEKIRHHPVAAKHLLKSGRAPRIGEKMAFPALAQTLRTIASQGPDAFYTGTIADEICATLADLGGVMTSDDLAASAPFAVDPIYSDYRGLAVAELPPNGQGVIALIILNILETIAHAGFDPFGPQRFHFQMEAGRIAYSIRDQFIADPASLPVSVDAVIDKAYGADLARRIDPDRRSDVSNTKLPPQTDTIYLSIVDKDRMAVSFINSVFGDFGSGIVTPNSGIALHNRGSGFSLEAGHPNELTGGKRPLHTIIPAFGLEDGKPILPFGVMGGAYQAVGHANFLTNLLDFGMGVQEALSAPRCFWEAIDGPLWAEPTLPDATIAGLQQRGHQVTMRDVGLGGGQAILIDTAEGVLIGGSDPRKDGCALGY